MTSTTNSQDYARQVDIDAPAQRVFDALATLEGIRGWWTSTVNGDPSSGGEITVRFEHLEDGEDQVKVLRVDEATPSGIAWTCVFDRRHPEWERTRMLFELEETGGRTRLDFRHEGLTRELECYKVCEAGWDYFLASIAGYVERGAGTPWPGVQVTSAA
jgi:uncharacterized protein YndB with AHSA1/START domain